MALMHRALVLLAPLLVINCSNSTGVTAANTPLARGQAFIEKRQCGDCHDPAADGTFAGSSTPVPSTMAYAANLTPDPDTGIGSWTDDQIQAAIRQSLDQDGSLLCTAMPQFPTMTDGEVND